MKWVEGILAALSLPGIATQLYLLWSYDPFCALIMLGAWAVVFLAILVIGKTFYNSMDSF